MAYDRLHWVAAWLLVAGTGCPDDAVPADDTGTGSSGGPATTVGATTGDEGTTAVADSSTTAPPTDTSSGGSSDTSDSTTGGPMGDGHVRLVIAEGERAGQATQLTLLDYDAGTLVATPVHAPLRDDRVIVFWGVSPAQQFIRFNAEIDGDDELFVASYADGTVGDPVRINVAPAPDPGNALGPSFRDDDSAAVVFAADPDFANPRLWLVDLQDGAPEVPVAMHAPPAPGGAVGNDVAMGSAGAGATFRGDLDGTGINNLYLVSTDPAATGGATQLSTHDDAAQAVASSSVLWLPDASAVLYRADADVDGVNELWWVGLPGGTPAAPQKINDDLAASQSLASVRVAPDSRAVAYWAGQNPLGEIFVSYLDGATPSPPVVVSTPGPGQALSPRLIWSSDGGALLYLAEHNTPGNEDAYYVDMSGAMPGTPDRINGQLLPGGNVAFVVFGPGGEYLYYVANQDLPLYELYRARIVAGVPGIPERISGEQVGGGGVADELLFAPDGSALLYRAVQDTAGVVELYMLELGDAVGEPVKINAELDEGFDVQFTPRFSSDGSVVIYRIAETEGGVVQLLLEDLTDGPGNPILLSETSQGHQLLPSR